MIEAARRHASAGCLVCVAGFFVVLVFAYWVGPTERLDRSVLDALSTSTDTVVNHIAYVGFQVVDFKPLWVFVAIVAALIALSQWRIRDAAIAVALVAGVGGLDLALKALLANPRYQPVPVGSDAYPWKDAFPSGHSAGSLAMALAFLTVVPLPGSVRPPLSAVPSLSSLASACCCSTITTRATCSPAGC